MTARKSIIAMQLSKELGLDYKTSWYMLHRIREACAAGTMKLNKVVEVGKTYVGGKRKNMSKAKRETLKEEGAGCGASGKNPVLGLRERGDNTIAMPVEDTKGKTLKGKIKEHTAKGSTIYADEALAYRGIKDRWHGTVNHSEHEYVRGDIHTISIEAVWAVLKRSIAGTWHHVSPKHLHRYVNEAAMRLNIGDCEIDTVDRMESLVRQIGGKRIAYRDLVADNGLNSEVIIRE